MCFNPIVKGCMKPKYVIIALSRSGFFKFAGFLRYSLPFQIASKTKETVLITNTRCVTRTLIYPSWTALPPPQRSLTDPPAAAEVPHGPPQRPRPQPKAVRFALSAFSFQPPPDDDDDDDAASSRLTSAASALLPPPPPSRPEGNPGGRPSLPRRARSPPTGPVPLLARRRALPPRPSSGPGLPSANPPRRRAPASAPGAAANGVRAPSAPPAAPARQPKRGRA